MSRKVWYEGSWKNIGSTFDTPGALLPVLFGEATVSVPTNASANTKGVWTEIVAETTSETNLIRLKVSANGTLGANSACLFDIGIGAAASEVALVSNIALPYSANNVYAPVFDIPVNVPSGSRLSVRWQSAQAGLSSCAVGMDLFDYQNNYTSPSSIVTIGANTAGSKGVDLGSSVYTYVEVEDSTSEDFRGVVFSFTNIDADMADSTVSFILGIGPSSEEEAVADSIIYVTSTVESFNAQPGGSAYIPRYIPSGSRLAAAYVDGDASNTGYSVVLLGVPV